MYTAFLLINKISPKPFSLQQRACMHDFIIFSSLKLLTFKMATGSDATSLNIVYYCTGHGLGHATRSLEVCKHLIAAGHNGK